MRHHQLRYGMWDERNRCLTKKEVLSVLASYNATPEEIDDYFRWVKDGNSFYENPGMIYGEDGRPLNFIEGCRQIEYLLEEYKNGR